ncbi:sensor domain-containing diguanylate cyclase [Actinoplanes sp. NPDC023801]|uniref:sensor domain-containing diguanylate cyclase n=1 Tax=Actinoplanes sp. NPDC023801 TaxID=3154595 RepID=UPI0033C0B31A
MRLRNWIAVLVSVLLLAGAGVAGILVNRSTVKAVETVHQNDTTALGTNNGTLTGQLQKNSTLELGKLLGSGSMRLGAKDAKDRITLSVLAAKSTTFQYGMATASQDRDLLTASRASGLPPASDPAWAPMWESLETRDFGFSGVMPAGETFVTAVAIPIKVGGGLVGYLIGFNQVAATPLHGYIRELRSDVHKTMIVDTAGRIGAASDDALVGGAVNGAIRPELGRPGSRFVEYVENDVKMIAVVVGVQPSGWSYVRTQTKAYFDGAVYSRSQTLNLTLLVMLVIGVVGITVLGYRTQITRRRADERFQALFQHAPDLVSVLDINGRIIFSSPSTTSVLGFKAGSLAGHGVFDVVHHEDQPQMREQLGALVADPDGVLRLQCRVRTAGGEFRWFDFTASNQMHNPALNGVVINARDISENRAFQERLEHEAQHDPLTGLPNRRRMQDKLNSTLRAGAVAVLFVDLNGFKPVNDAHGHEVGDELLRQVADRLSACVRSEDVLARVGGDEFVILMPGVMTAEDAVGMSGRVRYVLELPFRIDGHEIGIGASVGVHLAPAATDPDEALRAADHAMYEIKHTSRIPAGVTVRVGRHRAVD